MGGVRRDVMKLKLAAPWNDYFFEKSARKDKIPRAKNSTASIQLPL